MKALAVSGTTVYAGGSFGSIASVTRHRLAALDATSGAPAAWDPNVDADVLALAAWAPSAVYAGGTFLQVGSEERTGFAAFDAAADTTTSVTCLPATIVLGTPSTCTATVTDTSTSGKTTPTGAVDFSADGSSPTFTSGGSCSVSATGTAGQAACAVAYTPGAFDAGARTVTGAYTGDAAHASSRGTAPVTVISGPPSNVTLPTISGTAQQGAVLTEAHGSWTNGPTGYGYQWQACNAVGGGCSAIVGATGQTYSPTAGDVGHTLRVAETASNAGGASAPATSVQTLVVVPPAPSSVAPPSILGTARQGELLSLAHGTWANDPDGVSDQWEACDEAGDKCSPIAGATAQTYTLTAGELGHTIRVRETAFNAGGATSAVSSRTAVVTGVQLALSPPSSSAPPVISGTPVVGGSLSASTGAWSGTAPIVYAHQWQRCGPACTDVPGATAAAYSLVAADLGIALRVRVTAANAAGQAAAVSATVGPVAPSAAQITATLLREIVPTGKDGRIPALLRGAGYRYTCTALTAGRLTIAWYLVPKGARLAKAKPVLVATGAQAFAFAGRGKVKVKLSSKGRRLLAHAKTLKLTAKGSFAPTGSAAVTALKPFTLKR